MTVVENLLTSPIFWGALIVIIVILIFRGPIGGFISRATEASGKVDKTGISGAFKAAAPGESGASTSSNLPTKRIGGGVDLEDVESTGGGLLVDENAGGGVRRKRAAGGATGGAGGAAAGVG